MGYNTKSVSFYTYAIKCDKCRKHRKGWIWDYQYHFETMDGGDNFKYDECLLCHIKGMVFGIKYALKKNLVIIKTFCECWSYMTKLPWYSRTRIVKAFRLTKKMIRR